LYICLSETEICTCIAKMYFMKFKNPLDDICNYYRFINSLKSYPVKTKTLLSILALATVISAFAQKPTMELTFTAENSGQYVPMDSILIENLTQGGDTTLYPPDTTLSLEYNVGINETDLSKNTFSVSQNYPNPFNEKTTVNLVLPGKDNIKITCRNMLGIELAHYEKVLNRGNHSFIFYCGAGSQYLLTVTGKQTSKTVKMLNSGSNIAKSGKCKIVYNGNVTGFKSSEALNGFVFNLGDELKYTAYTDVEETEKIDSPTGSQTYTFQFDGWDPCPGMSIITDIDGNTYNTVQIGNQCWMKENPKTTTYRNGTAIPNITDANAWESLTTGAYVWYGNGISWKGPYGALYNWYAAVDANGLCPTEWHVPTDDEWTALTDFIGGTGSPHSNELKSCRQVNSPLGGGCNTTEHPRWNNPQNGVFGTDDYGFSGLPGGYRNFSGYFDSVGYSGGWWSSTESSSASAGRFLSYNDGYVFVNYYSKQDGFSVRCLRD